MDVHVEICHGRRPPPWPVARTAAAGRTHLHGWAAYRAPLPTMEKKEGKISNIFYKMLKHFANIEENTLKNQHFRKMLEHFAKC
jgi:hypothetical protein